VKLIQILFLFNKLSKESSIALIISVCILDLHAGP